MSEKLHLLAHVRQYLLLHNEEYEWITMGQDKQRIGIAYLPTAETTLPCTFMFTELDNPASLVFDAHFALRIPQDELPELSMLLATLNANIPEGQLLLDMEGGFVYYRLKYTPSSAEVKPEELHKKIANMEQLGLNMSLTYARIISEEFPTY